MSQTDELVRVKARIRALAEKTTSNGCTEAEAMSAAEMVGRLLERYALTMEQVDLRETPCVQLEVHTGGQRRRPIDGCVVAIARFCDCKIWLTRGELGVAYVFFGLETDAMLGRYLFEVIATALRTEVTVFKARNPRLRDVGLRRACESFQHGMVARVAARLTATQVEREASVMAQRASGNELMLVKHRLVEPIDVEDVIDADQAARALAWTEGERRFVHVRHIFDEKQKVVPQKAAKAARAK